MLSKQANASPSTNFKRKTSRIRAQGKNRDAAGEKSPYGDAVVWRHNAYNIFSMRNKCLHCNGYKRGVLLFEKWFVKCTHFISPCFCVYICLHYLLSSCENVISVTIWFCMTLVVMVDLLTLLHWITFVSVDHQMCDLTWQLDSGYTLSRWALMTEDYGILQAHVCGVSLSNGVSNLHWTLSST